MDDCGIPFSFRTRSAGGESALFVARRSIYFDLFAALLNFGITPPPSGTPRTTMRMRLLPDFCTQETKRGLFGRGGGAVWGICRPDFDMWFGMRNGRVEQKGKPALKAIEKEGC